MLHLKSWIFLFLLFFSQTAFAKAYPWVSANLDDVQIITDSYVDARMRIHLVNCAKESLDIITYAQRNDAITGIPFLQAVKNAAQRGVKVRFMTSWAGMFTTDPWNSAKKFMDEDTQDLPIDYMVVGGSPMWQRGWGYMDGIHEKLLISDQRWVLTTGRTHADDSLNWLDTAFIFRGPLVEQTLSAFNELWDSAKKEMGEAPLSQIPFSTHIELLSPDSGPSEVPIRVLEMALTSSQNFLFQKFKNWMQSPRNTGSSYQEIRMRVLHHDFLNQMRNFADKHHSTPASFSNDWRAANLEDPILDEVIRLVSDPGTKRARISAISTVFGSKLADALESALDRGVRIEVMTNSKASHSIVIPAAFLTPYLLSIGWYAGLEELNRLMTHGAQVIQPETPMFVHRKLAILDDQVIFGSHNLSSTSTTGLDEISFEVDSKIFAKKARRLFSRNASQFGVHMKPEEVRCDNESSGFKKWFCTHLKVFF